MPSIALTCDDAPTIAARPPHTRRDPTRMDRVRTVLQRHHVRHCVAFVIGAEATERGPLERWLAAGYELGNHTFDHRAASEVGVGALVASAARCDRLLHAHGAWARGQRKWFRFPFLDYGADADSRVRIAQGLHQLGYSIAHATVDLFDDRFEPALGAALARGSRLRAQVIGARYRRTAHRALGDARALAGPDVPQVAYFHFGAVSDRFFEGVLARWIAAGERPCALERALDDPRLRRDEGTGLLLASPRGPLVHRALRRVQGLHNRLEPSHGRFIGPPWPRVR